MSDRKYFPTDVLARAFTKAIGKEHYVTPKEFYAQKRECRVASVARRGRPPSMPADGKPGCLGAALASLKQ